MKKTYKEHPEHKGIWVSKSGQVMKLEDGELKVLNQHGSGYKGLYKSVAFYGLKLYVHHLVYQTYIQSDWDRNVYEMDHINGDPSNNKLNNLQLLTIRENRQKVTKRFKPIKITNLKTDEVSYAKSGIDAAELLNTQRYYISNALTQKKSILNDTYKLEYACRSEAEEYFNQL